MLEYVVIKLVKCEMRENCLGMQQGKYFITKKLSHLAPECSPDTLRDEIIKLCLQSTEGKLLPSNTALWILHGGEVGTRARMLTAVRMTITINSPSAMLPLPCWRRNQWREETKNWGAAAKDCWEHWLFSFFKFNTEWTEEMGDHYACWRSLIFFKKLEWRNEKLRQEKWLSGKDHWLLFQRIQLLFQHPDSHSQPLTIPVPVHLMPSSGKYMVHKHACRKTSTDIQ